MEIKNKLTVTRGKRDNGGKKGKGCRQGKCIKDTWTNLKQGRFEGGAGELGGRKNGGCT